MFGGTFQESSDSVGSYLEELDKQLYFARVASWLANNKEA